MTTFEDRRAPTALIIAALCCACSSSSGSGADGGPEPDDAGNEGSVGFDATAPDAADSGIVPDATVQDATDGSPPNDSPSDGGPSEEASGDAGFSYVSVSPPNVAGGGDCHNGRVVPSTFRPAVSYPTSFTVTNDSGVTVTWSATPSNAYIGLDNSGGTLAPGAQATANVSAASLDAFPPAMKETGTISITTSPAGSAPIVINAEIDYDGYFVSGSSSLAFGAVPAGQAVTLPMPQTITWQPQSGSCVPEFQCPSSTPFTAGSASREHGGQGFGPWTVTYTPQAPTGTTSTATCGFYLPCGIGDFCTPNALEVSGTVENDPACTSDAGTPLPDGTSCSESPDGGGPGQCSMGFCEPCQGIPLGTVCGPNETCQMVGREVCKPKLTLASVVPSAVSNFTLSGTLITFSDVASSDAASNFTATIDWGDGSTSAGTVSGASGSFMVTGSHTYSTDGLTTVRVTVNDSATASSPSLSALVNIHQSVQSFPAANAVATGSIATGADGNLWFGEAQSIAQMTPIGTLTEFAVTDATKIGGVAAGPDGNVWFVVTGLTTNGAIGVPFQAIDAISPAGTVTTNTIPTNTAASPAGPIVAGPGGALWYASSDGIARITTSGVATDYPLPPVPADAGASGCTSVIALTAGSDGNLWFLGNDLFTSGICVGTMTPQGVYTTRGYPTPDPALATGLAIVQGPDGAFWFSNRISSGGNTPVYSALLDRSTPTFQLTEVAPFQGAPGGLVVGPDGNLWLPTYSTQSSTVGSIVVQEDVDLLFRIATSGATTTFTTPHPLGGGTVGPDGALWYLADGYVVRIGPL